MLTEDETGLYFETHNGRNVEQVESAIAEVIRKAEDAPEKTPEKASEKASEKAPEKDVCVNESRKLPVR